MMTKTEALRQLSDMTHQRNEALQQIAEMEQIEMRTHLEWINSLEGKSAGDILKERDTMLKELDALKARLAGNMQGIGHISDKLRTLRQVGDQVWSNVDPSIPTSHPANNVAESALIARGWSPSQAKAGASIIRPEWAAKGRKAEE